MKEESIMIDILQKLDENLQFIHSYQEDNHLIFLFKLQTMSARCPSCGHLSVRPHSYYTRVVRDLPIQDQDVTLLIQLHKWFCDQNECQTKIFTERLEWLKPFHRKTNRLEEVLRTLAFSMSCLQAEKVCQRLHMPTSHDALLSLIKKTPVQPEHEDSPFCSNR